jgi:hypothetical protein
VVTGLAFGPRRHSNDGNALLRVRLYTNRCHWAFLQLMFSYHGLWPAHRTVDRLQRGAARPDCGRFQRAPELVLRAVAARRKRTSGLQQLPVLKADAGREAHDASVIEHCAIYLSHRSVENAADSSLDLEGRERGLPQVRWQWWLTILRRMFSNSHIGARIGDNPCLHHTRKLAHSLHGDRVAYVYFARELR